MLLMERTHSLPKVANLYSGVEHTLDSVPSVEGTRYWEEGEYFFPAADPVDRNGVFDGPWLAKMALVYSCNALRIYSFQCYALLYRNF